MAESSFPIVGVNLSDQDWRDLRGDEAGVVGDLDGSAYALTLPTSPDTLAIGSGTQRSLAQVAGFGHRIPAGETVSLTVPPASGSAQTSILALRYDPAHVGELGPVRATVIAGTSSALPTYDDSAPGVEDLPLWAITRQPGQSLSAATVQRLFPRLTRTLDHPAGAPLPLSSPIGTLLKQGPLDYIRTLGSAGTPVWVAVNGALSIRGSFARTDNSANLNALTSSGGITDLTIQRGVTVVGSGWTTFNPGNCVGYANSRPGRYRISFHFPTEGSGPRWEQLYVRTPAGQIAVANAGTSQFFGGVNGSYPVDAPNGISFGFRYDTNLGSAGKIRTSSWWDCRWEGPL